MQTVTEDYVKKPIVKRKENIQANCMRLAYGFKIPK